MATVDNTTDNMTGRVAVGSLWSVGTRWVMRFAGLANIAILARVLTLEDFGIIAIVMTVSAFALVALDTLAYTPLLRIKKPTSDHYGAALLLKVVVR